MIIDRVNQTVLGAWTDKIVSDLDFRTFQWVVYVGVITTITLFGMAANITNILVFLRMGIFADSSNVSLLGLAVSDFGGVASLLVMSLLTLIGCLDLPDLSWDPVSLMYVAGGWPHVIFVQMTCWITAYIAFERCMCVVFPFKIKSWFSPERSMIVICSVILYFCVSYLPVFLTRQLQWRRDPSDNITKLMVIFGPNHRLFEDVSNYVNIFISSTGSMIIVMVCTKITISRVQSSSNWRANVSSSGSAVSKTKNSHAVPNLNSCDDDDDDITLSSLKQDCKNMKNPPLNSSNQKEKKLVKMITIICTVFIVCNIPGVAVPYVRQFLPEIDHMARHHNLCYVIYGGCFVMESTNSSVNIFVYYSMSTRFRQEFRKLFHLK